MATAKKKSGAGGSAAARSKKPARKKTGVSGSSGAKAKSPGIGGSGSAKAKDPRKFVRPIPTVRPQIGKYGGVPYPTRARDRKT